MSLIYVISLLVAIYKQLSLKLNLLDIGNSVFMAIKVAPNAPVCSRIIFCSTSKLRLFWSLGRSSIGISNNPHILCKWQTSPNPSLEYLILSYQEMVHEIGYSFFSSGDRCWNNSNTLGILLVRGEAKGF